MEIFLLLVHVFIVAGTSHWSYIGFLRQQKMLYEFLASTKC